MSMFQSKTFRVALVEAACLFGIALLAVGLSPAKAAIYLVDQGDLQSQQCWPDCVSFGSLTGSITTDGTLGVGLSPSIITGWDLVLGDGVHTASLTTENSQITGNFPNLLSATRRELLFDFSPATCCGGQNNFEFCSLPISECRYVVTIFAPVGPGRGGIGISFGYTPNYESLIYLTGVQPIGYAAPEPSIWAMMMLGFAGLGFAGYRRVKDVRPSPILAYLTC
jgi:hypothetical protein